MSGLTPLPGGRTTGDGGLANVARIARREYIERVRSRLFVVSTVLLASLAVAVALIPLGIRLVDRATVSRVLVVAPDAELGTRAIEVMDGVLNGGFAGPAEGRRAYEFVLESAEDDAVRAVDEGSAAGAMLIARTGTGGLSFTLRTGDALGADRAQLLGVGAFAVAILDWTATQPSGVPGFVVPTLDIVAAGTPGGGQGSGQAEATSDFASRRIVGIVFVVLSFLTLVFYGMWVAAGVVAEKASRVMELLISAATARQLVVGKIVGIGLAGLTQVAFVLAPALASLMLSGQIADALLGPGGAGAGPSLAGLSPGLVAAFFIYFVGGFALYAALYAAAGSLVSRAEDLQVIALPLSLPALAGYLPAVLALSGGGSGLIRLASYVPLWSPFVMMARLSIGRVEPWELVLSIGLLAATVPLVTWLAIRVYSAGVLRYGQPPTVRAFAGAIRRG